MDRLRRDAFYVPVLLVLSPFTEIRICGLISVGMLLCVCVFARLVSKAHPIIFSVVVKAMMLHTG